MTPELARERLASRLNAVGGGDRAALREVYDSTSAKLFGICVRILDDREEAEDVLQDVYVTVWNKARTFDETRASPITWLATIARNRSIDRLRQIGPRRLDRPVEDMVDLADERDDGFTALQSRQEVGRLHECLGSLEERARGAIAQAFFSGRTYPELAMEAGLPLGTMKSLVRRGLLKLRQCLEP